MKKKNYLQNDFIDLNIIGEDDFSFTPQLTRKKSFLNLFKPDKDIYGTVLSKEDHKKRKKQIVIVCFLFLFASSTVVGGTIAIIKAQESSPKPKTYNIEQKIK